MKILLVEDDEVVKRGIEIFLTSSGFDVIPAENGKTALDLFLGDKVDLIITDIQMPEMNGLELLKLINEKATAVPTIIITAYATVENAVKAMQQGADDFLIKPINLEELLIKIRKISEKLNLVKENINLRSRLEHIINPDIISISQKMLQVKRLIEKIANDPDVSAIIYGESGTGKELVAKNIHARSARRNFPFMAINCAALPEELLESELFGYGKGAFTGAVKDKMGIFQAADKGTIFLDEVSEMSPKLQSKLLRALQEYEIQPVGKVEKIYLNVRIISASNVVLKNLVNAGKFRDDLFYRLNVIEINLPPLKERAEDVPLLINHFLGEKRKIEFSADAIDLLKRYNWPGNIRELKNLIKMLEVTSDKRIITELDLPPEILKAVSIHSLNKENILNISDFKCALNMSIEDFEKSYLTFYLNKYKGNISKTADNIGISRVSLHKKIKEYGIHI